MAKLDFNHDWEVRSLTLNETEGRKVSLPHDAMLGEERSSLSEGGVNSAWFVGGDYPYTKRFELPLKDGESAILEFEGAYRNAKVVLNGSLVKENAYGYNCFYADITSFLKKGENVLEVRTQNADQPNSRWYSGAGLYRPVWLHLLPKEHLILDSLQVETVDYRGGKLRVKGKTSCDGKVVLTIFDHEEKMVKKCEFEAKETGFEAFLELNNPHLWSEDDPYLYKVSFVFGNDERNFRIGVRQIEFNENGLFCNGKRILLKGACMHHDNGVLGAAAYRDAEYRKVRILKEVGYNAIRSSHNPMGKAMLDACDELGVYVLDEYVDCWYIHKTRFDYVDDLMANYKEDITLMVNKDFNHPCVIGYSLGNEVAETSEEKGISLLNDFVKLIKELDPNRLTTVGVNIFFNALYSMGFGVYSDKKANENSQAKAKKKESGSAFFNKLTNFFGSEIMKVGSTLPICDKKTRGSFALLDAPGYNYAINRYGHDHKKYPNRLILGTETFCGDLAAFLSLAQKYPRVIGDFVWSGFDYLGECGIGSWINEEDAPSFDHGNGWVTAGAGRVDITGRLLGEALFTQALLGKKAITMAVIPPKEYRLKHSPSAWKFSLALPHYDFPDDEIGKKVGVEVYSLAPSVALYLNGKLIGKRKSAKNGKTTFAFPYAKGEITAKCFDAEGKEVGHTTLRSSSGETLLNLVKESERPTPNDRLLYVRIRLENGEGDLRVYEKDEFEISSIQGGELLGMGNGNSYQKESFFGSRCLSYQGEAIAVFRVDDETSFSFLLTSGNHGKKDFKF